jgi:transposase
MQNKGKQLNFSGQNIYIGLDTHLKSWKVTIIVGDVFFKTFSQDPDAEILFNYLKKNFPGANYYSAYEASFSGFSAHRKLNKLGIKNIVVNPADIPTTDKERRQKEDARDSRKIAKQLAKKDLQAIHIPSIISEGDRALLRLRKTQTKEIARNKNRIKSNLYYFGIKIPLQFTENKYWSKRFTIWLRQVELPSESARITLDSIIETVEFLRKSQYQTIKRIKELSQTFRYKRNFELLLTVPGVGFVTAMTFLTEVETLLRFKNFDKLCAYIGLIPKTNSSGEKDRTGDITNRQNKALRSLIIESAWVAVRTDPALLLAFRELTKRMKPTKAIIRIAKKLVNRIRYVLKNQQKYEHAVVK